MTDRQKSAMLRYRMSLDDRSFLNPLNIKQIMRADPAQLRIVKTRTDSQKIFLSVIDVPPASSAISVI